MTRLLSTYLTIFHNTDMHINSGITNNIKLFWLKKRTDQLTPTELEIQVDAKERPTLTFRQFVNFILFCPTEIKGCDVSFIYFLLNRKLTIKIFSSLYIWAICFSKYEFYTFKCSRSSTTRSKHKVINKLSTPKLYAIKENLS